MNNGSRARMLSTMMALTGGAGIGPKVTLYEVNDKLFHSYDSALAYAYLNKMTGKDVINFQYATYNKAKHIVQHYKTASELRKNG